MDKRQMSMFDMVYVVIWQQDHFDNIVEAHRDRGVAFHRARVIVLDNAVSEGYDGSSGLVVESGGSPMEYSAVWPENKVSITKLQII